MNESRVALITGGAQGIGAACAVRLARSGADIVVVDRNITDTDSLEEAIRAEGRQTMFVACDVTEELDVDEAVSSVIDRFGRLDVLVNNAGVTRDNLLFKMSVDDWDAVLAVHLKGAFLFSRAAQQHMVAAKYGKIVNLSSQSALGNPGQANYSAAKMGIQGFTKTLAQELGRFSINVNAVAPGYVVTAMTKATAERLGTSFEEHQQSVAQRVPLRRVAQPEDVANVVNFLASDESSYVSGQTIYVNGGSR